MKKSTIALEQELFASIPIVINYKDDIFMRAFSGYGECSKKDITETDLKRDILARENGKEILSDLEQQYVEKKSRDAINCDDLLSDTFKDALADAYNAFYDEVIKIIKKLPSTDKQFEKDSNTIKSKSPRRLIERAQGSKNLCLVYQNGSDGVFQYETLENLLDTIAKVSVCYCLGLDSFDALPVDLQDSKTSKEVTTPMFIRNICVLTCYTILNLGKFAFIKYKHTQLPKGTGVCSQIMHELHERSKALGYECFIKEDKLFQSDKWSMSPVYMVESMSYVPPKMPASYAGMKEGYLGYMIARLQEQVPYNKFVDIFGGSGAASVQFRHREDAEYYINDFNYCIVSYYRIMQTVSTSPDYIEFTEKLFFLNVLYRTAFNQASDSNDFHVFSKPIFAFYEELANIGYANLVGDNNALNVLNTPLNTRTDLINAVNHISGVDIPDNIKEYSKKPISYIDAAVLFVYYMNHNISGIITYGIYSADSLFIKDFNTKKSMEKSFLSFRNVFNSTVIDPLGASAMDILADSRFNQPDTFVYSDSPYIGTAGYTVNKTVKNSLKPNDITKENVGEAFHSTEFAMDDLLQKCSEFKGKYIFSCRINMVRSDIEERMCRKTIAKNNGVRFILNNYCWFWRFWQQSDNYVLFMYNKDFKAKDVVKSKTDGVEWSFNNEVDENVVRYLYQHVFDGIDLEIMIINFDFETPNFDSMYEFGSIGNIHKKATDPFSLVPKNGEFIKMPVKTMAEIVLKATEVFVNKL